MTVTQMENILKGCLSGDNHLMKTSEQQLNEGVEHNTKQMANMLMQVIAVSSDISCKDMALVLMRKKLISAKKKYVQLEKPFLTQVRAQLLKSLQVETTKNIRRHLGDLIVEICKASPGEWQNLIPELIKQCSKGEDQVDRVFHVLIGLVDALYPKNMNQQTLGNLINLSGQAFQSQNLEVQISGLKLFGCTMVHLKNVSEYTGFIDAILSLLTNLVKAQDFDNCQRVLQVLVEIATDKATYFRGKLDNIIAIMREIGITESLEEDTRQLALEVLVTIVEREPAMVRKNKTFIHAIVDVSLKMMLDVSDDQEEFNAQYDTNVDDSPTFDSGQVALNRLAENISSKKFMPMVLPKLMELMNNNNWKCRHAALIAVAQTCELLHKSSADRDKMLQTVLRFAAPNFHYRVRYASVHCLGIMCTDYGKKFVNKWHNQILEVFMNQMQDVQNPRLQANAAICVVNLAERVSTKLLRPNLENLLRRLFDVLNNSKKKWVQENVLSAVCEVADNAEKEFVKYYEVFSKPLLTILQTVDQDEDIDLRLESLRCLSYIGQAVGPKLFSNDATRAMEISVPLVKKGVDILRIFNSWRRVFKTLQTEAVKFMGPVAEVCMKYAAQQVTFDNWQSDSDVEINEREVPVNSSRVEEKVAAINLIDAMARYCDGAYTPMVERSAGILLPLIAKPDDNSIQEAAAECLPSLSKSMLATFKKTQQPSVDIQMELFMAILQAIVQQFPKEDSMSSLCAFATSIQKLCKVDAELTKAAFGRNQNAMMAVTGALLTCLNDSAERMDARNASMQEANADDEDIDALKDENETEAMLSTQIADAVGAMIQVYKEQFLPFLSQSMDAFTYMLGANGLDIQKRAALYIFCDVISHCDPNVFLKQFAFLPKTFFDCAQCKDVLVRQAGVYGCGLLITKVGDNFGIPLIDVIKLCFAQFHDQKYLGDDVEDVQDNAAMTIGRICKKCHNVVPVEQIYTEWVNKCFPIRADDDCSQWCYAEFLRLIESRNPAFMSNNGANVGPVLAHMADAVFTDMSTEEIDQKFLALWKQIRGTPAMIAGVPQDLQKRINDRC